MLITSLVLGLSLGFNQVHLAAGDAEHGQVNDAGLGRLSQVTLLAHVGFGLVGFQHEVFERQQLVLLRLGHPLQDKKQGRVSRGLDTARGDLEDGLVFIQDSDSVPHTPSFWPKYSLEHQMWILLPLKIVPSKYMYFLLFV